MKGLQHQYSVHGLCFPTLLEMSTSKTIPLLGTHFSTYLGAFPTSTRLRHQDHLAETWTTSEEAVKCGTEAAGQRLCFEVKIQGLDMDRLGLDLSSMGMTNRWNQPQWFFLGVLPNQRCISQYQKIHRFFHFFPTAGGR